MNTAQQVSSKLIASTVTLAFREIDAMYENGDSAGLDSFVRLYSKWARASANGSTWALVAEYAMAARDVDRNGAWVACDDCGEDMHTKSPDDTDHICDECGDERDAHHGIGKYYDAFA